MSDRDVYVVGAGMHPFGRHEASGLDLAEHGGPRGARRRRA